MRERMSQQNSQSKSAALLQLLNKICVLISHRENVKSRSTFGTMQDLCDFYLIDGSYELNIKRPGSGKIRDIIKWCSVVIV